MTKKPLSERQVVAWAKAHYEKFGRWPIVSSGPVSDAPEETWGAINACMNKGFRGFAKGDSLAKFLGRTVGKGWKRSRPDLTIDQILVWASRHFGRTGRWPHRFSGPVAEAPRERWDRIDSALWTGNRGLPKGSSLARLLDEAVGRSRRSRLTPLSVQQVIKWAKQHKERTGEWPITSSGKVIGAPGETWVKINWALYHARRGFSGKQSLARLLHKQVGKPLRRRVQPLPRTDILKWAKDFHREHGRCPGCKTGPIEGESGLSWGAVNSQLLKYGTLESGQPMSLTNFFQKELGESARIKLSYHLTRAMILKWADEHYRRYGQWPKEARRRDDYVPLNWTTIGNALKAGRVAGVPERSTLARFLMQARDPTLRVHINTPLSINQILKWADAHHKRTGRWPINTTGRILEATPGETWYSVSGALKRGARGLPGGEYLASLLARERGVLAQGYKPILTHEKILAWAVAHHRRTGKWPTSKSGRVKESPAETWDSIRTSMRDGHRGLPAGITLAALFNSVRGDAGDLDRKGKLSVESIKLWARAQHRRHGKWPDKYSGAVPDARGETWFGIEEAIRLGKRGLPKGRSLSAFLSGLRSPMALPSARRRSTRAVRRSNAN